MLRLAIIVLLTASHSFAQPPIPADLKSLYDAQKWKELHAALSKSKGADLYCGAVAVIFHQNPRRAESLLRSAIKSAPESNQAYEAYEWLSHLYLYTGQYRRLISTMEARWAAFPEKGENEKERNELAGLRGLPDQITERVRPSILQHEEKSIFIPVTVNNQSATFFFDTGAWVSSISESEAKRLGLRFTDISGKVGSMTNSAAYRGAVADQLAVGNVHLRNVSFAVFPDTSEPWSMLPAGRRGILGIPIIVALRTLRWAHDGTVRLGGRTTAFDPGKSNLTFDDDHLVVTAVIQGRNASALVDTGAETTDLFAECAKQFPRLAESGKKDTTEVRAVGGAASYDSITLSELPIEVGGLPLLLRPAHILLSRSQGPHIGNFGIDLWMQGRAFSFDFTAMTLQIEPKK